MNLKNTTNNELVKLCVQEPTNRNVWTEFCKRFDERIRAVVYRECRQKKIAEHSPQFRDILEDLVQDIYLRLIENDCKALKDYKGASENSIFVWLGKIAKNVVINYGIKMSAKKRGSNHITLDDFETVLATQGYKDTKEIIYSNAEQNIDFEELKEQIEKIIDDCLTGENKERNKLIFGLNIYKGFSAREIASSMNYAISEKTIDNIISNLKREVREKLLTNEMEMI